MSIPNAQQLVVDIQCSGIVSAAGGRQIPQKNSFQYRRTATVFPLLKSQVETAFQANIVAPLAAALNIRWTQVSNAVRIMNDAQDAFYVVPETSPGAIPTDSYDSRSAIYMQLISGSRGRPYNGSKHFSPLSEADTTGDVLTGAGLTRFQTLATAILAGFTDAGGNVWVPVIVSGAPKNQILENPTSLTAVWDVVGVRLNKAVGSMKKRKCGPVY